ncbi:MAG: hypothetical protein ABFS34_13515, partial [Gemmatimonadota bacterium]
VRGEPEAPFRAADHAVDGAEGARLAASEQTDRRYLTTDARELTGADVAEAVTLAEPDILRALQRLPGVATRSDYTAELWTRGAPWSHTAVFWDGVPIANPLHALGVISGVSAASVGAVWFHPGTRPASMAGGAAGVVDLRSRRATGDGAVNAQADLSLAGVSLAADQRVLDGRAGWMLAGRHSYLDWLADLVRRPSPATDRAFPYRFGEVSGNVDARLGERTRVESSWLWESDRLGAARTEDEGPLASRWGNTVARATVATGFRGLVTEHSLGFSRHAASVREDESALALLGIEPVLRSRSTVEFAEVRGALWREPLTSAGPDWRMGYSVARHAVSYAGPLPLPVPRQTATELTAGDAIAGPFDGWDLDLPVLAIWGERTWGGETKVTGRAAVRAETGGEVLGAGAVRLAPRLALRYTPIPDAALSLGFARAHQYTQAVAPGGVQFASLVSTDAWLLAGPAVPLLRADIATAGMEANLAPGRVVAINSYARLTDGLTTPDPRPGSVAGRATFVEGSGTAFGLEISVRQLIGRVTGSAAYTLARSRLSAAGLSYPSAADRTHVFDGTLMARATSSLKLGAALTIASGAPFTAVVGDSVSCEAVPGCVPEALPWLATPHGARTTVFASLDLLVDWSVEVGDWQIGAFGQLRNALDRANATVYAGDGSGCVVVGCQGDSLRTLEERGVPRLPVVGLRVRL